MQPLEPDVIAYDENMGVLFQWQGVPDAQNVDDLGGGRLGQMAIQMAHLIRRRDGLVLKGEVSDPTEYGDEIILDTPAPRERKEPTRLERVELIPPPQQLVEHEPLPDAVLIRLALVKALEMLNDNVDEVVDYIVVDDKDIVRMLTDVSISIEHTSVGVMFRAHYGDLTVIPVAGGEVENVRELNVLDVSCPKCEAGPLIHCTTASGNTLSVAQSHADRFTKLSEERSRYGG